MLRYKSLRSSLSWPLKLWAVYTLLKIDERYHAADFCWRLCIMKMHQGMTMLIWATDDVIMSKLNTNNRPRNNVYSMFTFQWGVRWVVGGQCTSRVQPGVFLHTKPPPGGTAPVSHGDFYPQSMLLKVQCVRPRWKGSIGRNWILNNDVFPSVFNLNCTNCFLYPEWAHFI